MSLCAIRVPPRYRGKHSSIDFQNIEAVESKLRYFVTKFVNKISDTLVFKVQFKVEQL